MNKEDFPLSELAFIISIIAFIVSLLKDVL